MLAGPLHVFSRRPETPDLDDRYKVAELRGLAKCANACAEEHIFGQLAHKNVPVTRIDVCQPFHLPLAYFTDVHIS